MVSYSNVDRVGNVLVEVSGLNGIEDYGDELNAWLKQIIGSVNAAARARPNSSTAIRAEVNAKIREALKVSPPDVLGIANSDTSDLPAPDRDAVRSAEGRASLANVGKKAQLEARLSHAREKKLLAAMNKTMAKARSLPGSSPERAALVSQAVDTAKKLLAERVKGQRAAVVAGSILAALQFAQRATRAKSAMDAQFLYGQASAAVDVGQAVAKASFRAVAPVEDSSEMNAPGVVTNGGVGGPPSLPPLPSQFGGRSLPGRPALPPSPARPGQNLPALPPNPARPQGLGGLGDIFGDAFNFVKNAATSVIPSHTIVGQALAGNYGQAATQAVQFVGNVVGAGQPQPTPPLPQPQQEVANAVNNGTNAVKPPGMTNPFGKLPGWVLPAGIAAAAVGAGLLLL